MNANVIQPGGRAMASYRWPLIVLCFLGGHMTLMSWAVFKATSDTNSAVIPNAYQKSLQWDEQKAKKVASEGLGWKLGVELDGAVGTFTLKDAAGNPVEAGGLELTVAHEARALEVQRVTVGAVGPGVFKGTLPVGVRGFYRIGVKAVVGEKVFGTDVQTFVK